MAGLVMALGRRLQDPFCQGFLLLVFLITLFLGNSLFTGQPLLAADMLFYFDPLWQPLAPPGYSVPANQVLSDQIFQFYPWQKFIRTELARGRLPLWNPYVYSGQPFVGNAQSALFDPFNLISLLSPLAQSFVVVAYLRLLCAGTFTLLLALELGLSRFSAYLAMIVFTFGGPQVVWLLYPKASVLVWLPAVLFLSVRLIRTGQWRYAALLGLVMAAQLVGGHPETALYSALVWLFFSGYWLWLEGMAKGRSIIRPRIIQLAAAGLLGLGAGAIQWLPIVEALLQSEILSARQLPLTWEGVFFQWREWLAALTMLMPDFFGNPRHHTYWYPYSNYTEQTLFVGVVPLALALVAIIAGKGRKVAFFTALALICLGLALRLPVFPLLAEVPILNVTNSGRMRGIYMLAVALLAGYGLDIVRRNLVSDESIAYRNGLVVRVLAVLGLTAALVALIAFSASILFQADLIELGRVQAWASRGNPFFLRPLEEYNQLARVRVEQMIASFHPANWRMYLPLYITLLVLLAWLAIGNRRGQRLGDMAAGLLTALVVGELWFFGIGYNPTTAPEQVYPTPELVESLLQEEPPETGAPYRVMGTDLTLVPNVGMVFGLEDIRGYDPVAPRRYLALMSRLEGAVRVGYHLLFAQGNVPFFDFLNVRYLFTPHTYDGERWAKVQESNGVNLYMNQQAMPRAFMVYNSQVAATPAESLEMTLAPDFDFRNRVVVEGMAEAMAQGQPPAAPVVEITHYAPGEMMVQVDTPIEGLLVVSDPYTTGWLASVDGEAVEILIANHAFRAVQVPEGNHTISFRYRPVSFTIGAWVSAASLVALLLLLVLGERGFWGRRSHGGIA